MTTYEREYRKDEAPNITCVLGDEDVLIRFSDGSVRYSYDYKISAPENLDATHLMKMQEDEEALGGYAVQILRKDDGQSIMSFTLQDQEGKTVVRDFYENFCAGFAVCLVEQKTLHMQAVDYALQNGPRMHLS
jgi:hypothetical protein